MARKVVIPGYFPPQVAAKATAIGPLVLGTAGRAYPARPVHGTAAGRSATLDECRKEASSWQNAAYRSYGLVGVQVDACVQRKSFDEGGVALALGRGVVARGLPGRQRGVLSTLQEVERVWLRHVGRRTQQADQPAGGLAQQHIELRVRRRGQGLEAQVRALRDEDAGLGC